MPDALRVRHELAVTGRVTNSNDGMPVSGTVIQMTGTQNRKTMRHSLRKNFEREQAR